MCQALAGRHVLQILRKVRSLFMFGACGASQGLKLWGQGTPLETALADGGPHNRARKLWYGARARGSVEMRGARVFTLQQGATQTIQSRTDLTYSFV